MKRWIKERITGFDKLYEIIMAFFQFIN